MGLYSGGLIIGRISASDIWESNLREGFGGSLLLEFYGMLGIKIIQVSKLKEKFNV